METCIWEAITDVMLPIVVAIIGVYIAEYFARKRDWKQKRIEIMIDYMQKEISYLSEMESLLISAARQVDKSVTTHHPDKRDEMYNVAIGQLSEINIRNRSLYYNLDCYNKAMSLEIDIEKDYQLIGQKVDKFAEMCECCIQDSSHKISEDDINALLEDAKCEIESTIKMITSIMVEYLKK